MAQERCFRKTYQYGRLWTPGEVRTCDLDEDGGARISNHFVKVGDGEVIEDRKIFSDEKVQEARREAGLRDRKTAIQQALYQLDPEEDKDWTRGGQAAMAAVFARVDFEVTRNEIQAAAPDFDREAARQMKTKS